MIDKVSLARRVLGVPFKYVKLAEVSRKSRRVGKEDVALEGRLHVGPIGCQS